MHVRIRCYGLPDRIVAVQSKLMKIEKLKLNIEEKYDITSKSQRLFYGGKLLENNCTLYDYNIKLNDVIQLIVNTEITSSISEESVSIKQNDKQQDLEYINAESDLYEIEDLVDVKHKKQGKWQEGKIIRIVHEIKSSEEDTHEMCQGEQDGQPNLQMAEDGTKDMNNKVTKKTRPNTAMPCLYKIQLDSDDEEEKYYEESDIRPRSRTALDINELQVGQKVMVNYNIESPDEKGDWYDFKVEQIKKFRKNHVLVGTLYFGGDLVPQSETKIKVHDKIFAIEEAVHVAHRTNEYNTIMKTLPEKRSKSIICKFCRDESELCRECGCSVCWSKQEPTEIVLCDECNLGYHMKCLQPAMDELPEGDWYCPNCARDTSAVVAPGASSQPRKKLRSSRDWGRGMACVGKTKTCAMPANHFGSIPGIEVGMCWRFRIQLSESGVHRPPVSGIHGRDVEGAYSIVLSGGYEDDVDNGNEFTYTGSGGRDLSGNKRTAEQSCDQRLTRENRALARNCASGEVSEAGGDAGKAWRDGKPVRVVRSYKMLRHFPKYAPPEGIRYDGIYKVVKYYQEVGLSGFKVWKYMLRRDDPSPAPWERGAKQYPVIYPDGYLEAQAEKKNVTEKKIKAPKSGKKKGVGNENLSNYVREEVAPGGTETNNLEEPTNSKNTRKTGKKGAIHENHITTEFLSEKVSPNEIITENRTGTKGTLEHNNLTSESSCEVDEVYLDKIEKENNEEAVISERSNRKRNRSKSEDVTFSDTDMDNLEQSPTSMSCTKTVNKRVLRDRNLISNSVPGEVQVPPNKKRKGTPVQIETSNRGPEKSNHRLRQGLLHAESLLSEEERKAIEADTLNAKLWADCLETEHGGKKEFMDFMIQSFNCIICRDVLVNPVTTECLHNYCLGCLRMMFRASAEDGDKPTCPCCRQELSQNTTPTIADINLPLQTALRTIMPGYDAGSK